MRDNVFDVSQLKPSQLMNDIVPCYAGILIPSSQFHPFLPIMAKSFSFQSPKRVAY